MKAEAFNPLVDSPIGAGEIKAGVPVGEGGSGRTAQSVSVASIVFLEEFRDGLQAELLFLHVGHVA